jgi:hypothetical protein
VNRSPIHAGVAVSSVLLAVPGVLWWSESVLFVIGLSLFANCYAAISVLEAFDDSKLKAEIKELRAMIKKMLDSQ